MAVEEMPAAPATAAEGAVSTVINLRVTGPAGGERTYAVDVPIVASLRTDLTHASATVRSSRVPVRAQGKYLSEPLLYCDLLIEDGRAEAMVVVRTRAAAALTRGHTACIPTAAS